jgi:PAS domain S-box-containing protein
MPQSRFLIPTRTFLFRLAVPLLLINLFVAGLAGFTLYRSRQQYESRTVTQTQNLAQSLNLTIAGIVDKTGLAVFSVKREAEQQLKSGRFDTRQLHEFIMELKGHIPELDGLRMTNDRGDVICGDKVAPGVRVNIADRPLFLRLKNDPAAGVVIGAPVYGRISQKWVVQIAHRITGPDGSFAGIVIGAISLDYLARLFSTFDLGRNGVLTLRDGDMAVIVRYPEPAGMKNSIGSTVISRQLRELYLAGKRSGTYRNPGSIDQVERVFSFSRLARYPLYVTAGLATSDYLQPWYAEARQVGVLVMLFTSASLGYGWLLLCNRRRRQDAEVELIRYRDHLEETVLERTSELEEKNLRLAEEIVLRRQVEDDLRKAAVIMERMSDAVCWVSPDGAYIYVNDAACGMHGYSRDEMLALSVTDIAVHLTPDAWRHHWEELKREACLSFEAVNRTRDGREFPVEVTANYLNIDGFEYNCAIVRDISERKAAEAERQELMVQLGQSQKIESIGRLAGGIAHDFNNLLTPILGYAELLKATLPVDSASRHKVDQIIQAADRAKVLTQQLLSFGRKQILNMATVNLNEVVTGFYEILRRTIREDIDLRLHLAEGAYGIRADRNQLEQIILNLAINAQDAIADRGFIAIETAPVKLDDEYARQHAGVTAGSYLMLAITDNGCGMSRETQEQIFEPFFTTKESGKGSGLGLATVYGLVKQHGGHIWVYSEPGNGAVFKIYFPMVADDLQVSGAVPGTEPAAVTTSGATVLLVEDNGQVRNLVHDLLVACGYGVCVAEGPEQALELMSDGQRPDLLLTDVVMPGMNGPELHRRLAGRFPDLKVLYMSGYTNNVIVHHGVLDEGIQFIQKPFAARELAAKIEAVLRGAP